MISMAQERNVTISAKNGAQTDAQRQSNTQNRKKLAKSVNSATVDPGFRIAKFDIDGVLIDVGNGIEHYMRIAAEPQFPKPPKWLGAANVVFDDGNGIDEPDIIVAANIKNTAQFRYMRLEEPDEPWTNTDSDGRYGAQDVDPDAPAEPEQAYEVDDPDEPDSGFIGAGGVHMLSDAARRDARRRGKAILNSEDYGKQHGGTVQTTVPGYGRPMSIEDAHRIRRRTGARCNSPATYRQRRPDGAAVETRTQVGTCCEYNAEFCKPRPMFRWRPTAEERQELTELIGFGSVPALPRPLGGRADDDGRGNMRKKPLDGWNNDPIYDKNGQRIVPLRPYAKRKPAEPVTADEAASLPVQLRPTPDWRRNLARQMSAREAAGVPLRGKSAIGGKSVRPVSATYKASIAPDVGSLAMAA